MKLKLPELTSLTQKFMLGILPIALGGILIMGATAFYATRGYITTSVEKEAGTFAHGAALGVSDFFKQRQNDITALSESPLFADYHNNADYGLREEAGQYRGELERYFLKFSRRSGVYTRITYLGADQREICAIENLKVLPPGRRFHSASIFAATKDAGNTAVRLPITEDPLYGPQMTYAKPILDERGAIRGVLVMEASLKTLRDMLAGLQIGNTGRTYLADMSGKPLISPAPIPGNGPFSSSDFTAGAPVAGTDFKILVAAPMSDFQAPLKTITRLTVTLALACGGVVSLFIYFAISSITRPVKKLVEATRNLAQGVLNERVRAESRDELGLLADSFNLMAEQLTEKTGQLQSRIKELLVLQKMSTDLIEKLEERHICRICLEAAATAIGFERGVLYLVNGETSMIEGRYVHFTEGAGFDESKMRLRAVPLNGNDILASVVRGRKAVNVKNPLENPLINRRFIEELATSAFCLVPMLSGDKVIGVIGADNYYSNKPITDEQVKNLGLFGNFTALALENAKLMADVKASEEKYRTVLDNSPDAIIGLDPSFHITVWNSGAQSLFGYPAEEILGQRISKLFDPLTFESVIREVLKTGFFSKSCLEGVASRGKKLELDITWAGSGKEGASGREWTVVMRDTSEQRKLQSQLIQAEKLSAVGQLISGVAHELNNPLTAILGYSEIIRQKNTDPVSVPAGDIAGIYESSLRCGEIVRNLLAFVRESRGKRRAIDVSAAAKSAIALTSYKLRKAENITLTYNPADYLPPVMVDFHQIEQILVNLIQNACDALSQRSGEKKIEIGMYHHASSVFLTVSDNGPGIAAELTSKIFEPFFTTKEEGQGTGLGLAICRRIAADHGGNITCSSVPGISTKFTLELPIVNNPKEEETHRAAEARKPSPGKRVLVVDDEADILALFRRILESEGHIVETATGGLDAVEKLKKENYHLVICDMEMGPTKGFSVREMMLEMNSKASLIFTTGNLLNPALIERLRALNVPFLPKPFNISQLLSTMYTALS